MTPSPQLWPVRCNEHAPTAAPIPISRWCPALNKGVSRPKKGGELGLVNHEDKGLFKIALYLAIHVQLSALGELEFGAKPNEGVE